MVLKLGVGFRERTQEEEDVDVGVTERANDAIRTQKNLVILKKSYKSSLSLCLEPLTMMKKM